MSDVLRFLGIILIISSFIIGEALLAFLSFEAGFFWIFLLLNFILGIVLFAIGENSCY